MKLRSAFAIIYLAATINCSGQTHLIPVSQPTTEEEYNYVTKGYQTQVADGLDMKKGYHFKDMFEMRRGNYDFTAKGLIRESTDEVVGILVIAKSLIWNKTYYLCIPHGNQVLVDRYWNDIGQWDREMSIMYSQVFTLGFGGAVSSLFEVDKKSKNSH